MLGYYLAGARDVPAISAEFFPDAPAVLGWGLWVAHALLLTLPWLLLWPRPGKPLFGVLASFLAILTVLTFPPFGIFSWLSPLLVAGELFPGTGWLGLAGGIALLSVGVVLPRIGRDGINSKRSFWLCCGTAGLLLVTSAVTNMVANRPEPPAGWVSVDTALGRYPDAQWPGYQRQQALIEIALRELNAGAKVLLLPEEIAGNWRPAVAYWWAPVAELAANKGAVVLIGADIAEGAGYRDSVIVLGQGRDMPAIGNRVPMPVSLWRPWSEKSAAADPFAAGVHRIAGQWVALSVCYEDFLVWPMLRSMASSPAPAVIISMANNWFATDRAAVGIQRRSITSWGRLFGIPVIRAVNLKG